MSILVNDVHCLFSGGVTLICLVPLSGTLNLLETNSIRVFIKHINATISYGIKFLLIEHKKPLVTLSEISFLPVSLAPSSKSQINFPFSKLYFHVD